MSAKLILDDIVRAISHRPASVSAIYLLVCGELCLTVLGDLIRRNGGLAEHLLGTKFTNHFSLKMTEHAMKLDLAVLEDPGFFDKLDRARRLSSGAANILSLLAGTMQQLVSIVSCSFVVLTYSPLLFLLLLGSVVPVFLDENRHAKATYAIRFRRSPEQRELDYFRSLAASNNGAKEVRIFQLGQYLADRSEKLFERFYAEMRALAVRRTVSGFMLGALPTTAYYGAYMLMLHQTLLGHLSLGTLSLLAGACLNSRSTRSAFSKYRYI